MKHLRDLGNSVLVVEHDEDTMRAADFIVDVGPGAGIHGGEIVAAGTLEDIMACPPVPDGAVPVRGEENPGPCLPEGRQRQLPHGAGRSGEQFAECGRVHSFGDLHLRHRRFRIRKVQPGQ